MTLNLLLAIPALDRGGPDRVFADLLHHFDRERIRPAVFLTSDRGHHLQRLPDDVEVLVSDSRHPMSRNYPVAGLVRAARSFRPDVILTTLRMVQTASAARPLLNGVPHVARIANQMSHQFDDLARGSRARAHVARFLMTSSLRSADHIVCQSARMATDLRKFGFSTGVSVIGNGIEIPVGPFDGAGTAQLRGAPRLLFVGRLAPQKGVDVLVAALGMVLRRHPQAVLTIAGEGPERDSILDQVDESGLSGHVDLLGQVEDPFPLYRGADVLVAPSRYEGFSNTVLEALASGTPVVTTADAGTGDEVIRPGFNGELAATADPVLVTEAIERLLRRPAPCREALALDVTSRFDSDQVAREYEALVRSVHQARCSPDGARGGVALSTGVG
jgi:glycosyltransferase involved in cell wall biosynthesis